MADMISILVFIIFAYFAGKKLIIPRIVAARAAKKGTPAGAGAPRMEGFPADQTAPLPLPDIQTGPRVSPGLRLSPGLHSVTCFDMRLVDATICDYDENGDKNGFDAFAERMKHAASDLLLNASTRGDNVRLYALNLKCCILLYVTYEVR